MLTSALAAVLAYGLKPAQVVLADRDPAGTAEWIMERTTVGGKLPYLADYDTLSVSKAKACDNSNSSCHTISGLGNAFRWTMLTCNQQTIMSETSGLSGGNAFTATWENKGDNDVC